MSKKPFGATIRQEIIQSASYHLRVALGRGETVKTEFIIEGVVEGGRTGTLGGQMKDYVAGLSDVSFRRLEREIREKAGVVERFVKPCTCRLVAVVDGDRYIGGESDCPVHGFGK